MLLEFYLQFSNDLKKNLINVHFRSEDMKDLIACVMKTALPELLHARQEARSQFPEQFQIAIHLAIILS